MATSDDTVYELTRDNIISAAMRKCGALAKGQSPDSEDLTNGMQALNALIASWQSLGLTMWKTVQQSITMVDGTKTYLIGIGEVVNLAMPTRLEAAFLNETATGIRTPIEIRQHSDHMHLGSTNTEGKPVSISFIPLINKTYIDLWPTPDATTASNFRLHLFVRTAFEGFNSASETPDFPQEFQLALIYGLAVLLAPEYGVPLQDRQILQKEASYYLDRALDATQGENESIRFQVDMHGV